MMTRLEALRKFFCFHKYKKESVSRIRPRTYRYYYRCSKCGKLHIETWEV